MTRRRLPNRRPAHNETLEVDGQSFTATIGFDPKTGEPRELFLTAGKEGSTINRLLADAAITISVALQNGVGVGALTKSVGRLPNGPVMPDSLDSPSTHVRPASAIGRALDLLGELEGGAND